MKTVSSLKNPAVQAARALRDARERARQGAFLLDGEHMVGEALAACPDRVSALFVDEARLEAYAALTALVPQTACYAVPSHVLAAISQVKTPQGVAAVCAMPPSPAPEEMGNRLILLENVQDPGNVGTVLRTLDAAGFDGCILTPGCADPFGPKALRASMGAAARLRVVQTPHLPDALAALRQKGVTALAAALYNSRPLDEVPAKLPGGVCLVIGSEGQGLTDAAVAACSAAVRIPITDKVESLNAGVAGSVLLWHFRGAGR